MGIQKSHTMKSFGFVFNRTVPYEACDVHMHERGHQILTIEPVHYPTMSGNGVCKILQKQTMCQSVTCAKF